MVASLPVVIAGAGSTFQSFGPGLGGTLLHGLCILVVSLWIGALALRTLLALFRRHWRVARQRAVVIVSAASLAVLADRCGDYVHLGLMYPRYRVAILEARDRPVAFFWGDAALWVTDGFIGRSLIWDDSESHVPKEVQFDGKSSQMDEHRLIGNFFIETTRVPLY